MTLCATCGQQLNTKGDCLACLIRNATEEASGERAPLGLVSLR